MLKKVVFLILFLSVSCVYSQFSNVPDLVDYANKSVVKISTDYGLGSGVVISSRGYILTNFHVVENAYNYQSEIFVHTFDKDILQAKIIDFDDDFDLCLLKVIDNFDSYPLSIVSVDSIKVGEDVVAIGNPFGVSDFVTKGIISKYNTPYVFTSASINPGNSGGALLNMKGELVGITTMQRTDAQNFNIAVCPRTINYFLKKNNIRNE